MTSRDAGQDKSPQPASDSKEPAKPQSEVDSASASSLDETVVYFGGDESDANAAPITEFGGSTIRQMGGQRMAGTGFEEADDSFADDTELPVGKAFGRYVIEMLLGRGGMGEVFLARDRQLDRQVAIKIPTFQGNDEESVARFYREARAMATVHHAGLCPVYDVGEIEGRLYLSMAYIEGRTLSHRIATGSEFTEREAARLLRDMADALSTAHQAGIVHRDLKPGNVMITKGDQPVIMDFGLAQRNQLGEASLTHSGMILGTPSYMSPEQAEARQDDIDARTDIWALGVILYHVLTGRRPFEGSSASVFGQIVSAEPTPVAERRPGVSPMLVDTVNRALSKPVADRHETAAEFVAELDAFLNISGEHFSHPIGGPSSVQADSVSRQSQYSGVLRNVTVAVFCLDDPGLSIDPEKQEEGNAVFAELVRSKVEEFGGVLLPADDIHIVSCFGFPVAHEDSAARAVRAGRSVLTELTSDVLTEKISGATEDGTITVVVHSGETIAKQDPMDGSISLGGEVRGTALRLDAVSDPGSIVVTKTTQERTEAQFEWESLGETRVRGLAQPVELFKVTGEVDLRSRVDLVDPGNLTPLIGRDTEMAILRDRWEQTLDELGQVVVLIGDAGLGKSRLIREIRNHVRQDEDEPATVIEMRCADYQSSNAFYPITQYLQRMLKFDEVTDSRMRAARAEQSLKDLGLHSDTNLSLLQSLLSVELTGSDGEPIAAPGLSPQLLKEKTLEFLLKWLHGLAEQQPLLFIVEDLHWADASTLELLTEHVTKFSAGQMMTLLTFRPEFQTPWSSSPHQTQVALNRLPKRQIKKMIAKRTGRNDVPDWVVDQLIDRTDGVPLFIEEFCNLLEESGALDASDGSTAGSAIMMAIPATLQDLLVARLSRMESNQDVVKLAATIGREFSYQLISAASELPEQDLNDELDKLVSAELLFQKGQIPDAQFIFKHALIQDSAYNSLLKKQRQEFHACIATTLEKEFPETAESQPALLAHHLTEADIADRAIEYWQKAGASSVSRFANLEAIDQFQAGLRLIVGLEETPERNGLELSFRAPLGTVLLAARGYAHPEAAEELERARELAVAIEDYGTLFFVSWGLWARNLLLDRLDEALERGNKLIELAEQIGDPGLIMEAHYAPLCTLNHMGRFADALKHAESGLQHDDLERCTAMSQHTGQNAHVCFGFYKGLSLWMLGYPDQARAIGKKAIETAESINDLFTLAHALNHTAWVHHLTRDASATIANGEREMSVSAEQSFMLWEACGRIASGLGYSVQGDHSEAITRIREGIAGFRATGAELHVVHGFVGIAASSLELGDLDAAEEAIQEGFRISNENNEKYLMAELHRLNAELMQSRSADLKDVEAELETAISVARGQQALSLELRSTLALAKLWKSQDRLDEAAARIRPVFERFTEGHDTPDLVEAAAYL